MTIREAANFGIGALKEVYGDREARNIICILFEDLFQITNLELDQIFDFEHVFFQSLERLKRNEPVQHIVGYSNFYGYNFKVNQHVLVPRPETEELVHWILTDLKNSKKQLDVLDIGTGSGCIGITLKKEHPGLRLFAIEVSLDALNVARINSRTLRAPMTIYNFNFLEESYWNEMGKFNIIVSNPPYIDNDEKSIMADNVLLYEPEMALFAGSDSLLFYKKIAAFAQDHLLEGGLIYLEINENLATETAALFTPYFKNVEIREDLQGRPRMIKAHH